MKSSVLLFTLLLIQYFSYSQDTNKTIIDWGDNTNFQLDMPFDSSGIDNVSSGYIHVLTLANGKVGSLGGNVDGQRNIPEINQDVIAISAGFGHSMALLADSTVVVWGSNSHGQKDVPDSLVGVSMISAGEIHSLALLDSGKIVAWGDNSFGQLDVSDTLEAMFIDAGHFHNLAILSDSTVIAWGKNDFGQTNVPVITEKIIDVAAGEFHSVALSETGNVYAWGDNTLFGQLNIPSSIQGNVINIEAGNHHTIALLRDSTLAIWGNSTFNQRQIPKLLEGRTVYHFDAGYSYNTTVVSNKAPKDISLETYEVRENPDKEWYYLPMSSEDYDVRDVHDFKIKSQEVNQPFFVSKSASHRPNDLQYDRYELSDFHSTISTFFPFDYEKQSTHVLTLQVTDIGGLTYTEDITIEVIDINEAPDSIFLDTATVFESQPIGTFIGNFSSSDPDTNDEHTYSLSSGPGSIDNRYFFVYEGKLYTNYEFNYSERQSYLIRVRSTDKGGLHTDENFVITIEDINNPPTKIALDNSEMFSGLPVGTFVGTLITEDADEADVHHYVFNDSTESDNHRFELIQGKLYTNDIFEADEETVTISVTSTDSGEPPLSITGNIEITIVPANQSPTDILLSNQEVNKLAEPGLVVGIITAVDPDPNDLHVFELIQGAGDDNNESFVINENKLYLNQDISAYEENTMSVRIKATDNGSPARLSVEKQFELQLYDGTANNAPTAIMLSSNEITENNAIGELIGQISATDPDEDEKFIFTLTNNASTDNSLFYIEEDKLYAAASFDYENDSSHPIEISVQDQAGATFQADFTINIIDSEDSPTDFTLTNISIAENNEENIFLSEIIVEDDDNSSSYQFTVYDESGNESEVFYVSDDDLYVATSLNYEVTPEYKISILLVESTDSLVRDFTIFVTNVDEAPTDITLNNNTINEAAPIGTVIGSFTVVDEDLAFGNTLTFVNGEGDTDNDSFELDGYLLVLNDSLNFDNKNSYDIRVAAVAQDGTSIENRFTIEVTEENLNNLSPEALILDGYTIAENGTGLQFVGKLITIDPDDTEGFFYYLSEGNGDEDNESFSILGDSLFAKQSFDFESKYVYSIRVTTQDDDGESYSQSFYINVEDVNEAPTDITLSNYIITANENKSTFIAYITTDDEDINQSFNYELEEGVLHNDFFKVLNGNELWANGEVNTLNVQEVSLEMTSTDNGSPALSTTKVLELTISKPPNILSTYFTVSENAEANHSVGQIQTDAQGTFVFEITSGNTGGAFKISTAEGILSIVDAGILNFDEIPKYQLGIQVTNENNLSSISVIEVEVIPVDRPTLNAGYFTIAESSARNELVGAVDVISDAPEELSYAIINGNTDNTFSISNGEILVANALDYETKSTYELLIEARTPLGFFSQALYIINITNANDAPYDLSINNSVIKEKQPVGTVVGKFSVEDEDVLDQHTYHLESGAEYFAIDNDLLVVNSNITFSETPSITAIVRCEDSGTPVESVSLELEITIEQLPPINIPNAFSPDGNGINDYWIIENLEHYHNNKIEVHDQQGRLVFTSTGKNISWDGNFNGESLPVGNYYYLIKLNREDTYSGIVTIIK